MEITKYLIILWRRKWLILTTTLMAIIVAVAGTSLLTPKYESSVLLRLATTTRGSPDWIDFDLQYADRMMNTYRVFATSSAVQNEVVERLSLPGRPAVEVEILANTELMRISVRDTDPWRAAATANSVAAVLIEEIMVLSETEQRGTRERASDLLSQFESELARLYTFQQEAALSEQDQASIQRTIELLESARGETEGYVAQLPVRMSFLSASLSVFEEASVPVTPVSPNRNLNIMIGAFLGLLGGLGLALLLTNLDSTLYTVEEIEAASGAPIVAQIPLNKRTQDTLTDGNLPQDEAFRRLRIQLLNQMADLPKALMISSAQPSEGKTTVVTSLAMAMARAGHSVVVVEGNLSTPRLHERFKLPNKFGLSNYLEKNIQIDQVLQKSRLENLHVITSGPPLSDREQIGSERMEALIDQLKQRFSLVLLDSPALLTSADATALSTMVDSLLMVVGYGQARREAVEEASRLLRMLNVEVTGLVVNRADSNYSGTHHTEDLKDANRDSFSSKSARNPKISDGKAPMALEK